MSKTATQALTIRRADDRGCTDAGWLDSRHSFSFGEYLDREHLGFRSLRVINDDRVAPSGGFPPHGHREMEIFSYVLSGALAHRDSMGHARVLRPGALQLMSAGAGVVHAEENPSEDEPVHFLQVWIHPSEPRAVPRYTEWSPRAEDAAEPKVLLISPDGRDGSAAIRQDAEVHRLRVPDGGLVTHRLRPGRGAWLQVIDGAALVAGERLTPGDGASTEDPGMLEVRASGPLHALLFDLA